MLDFKINYPSNEHENYILTIYEYCKRNNLSLLLKGSLSNNIATKYSDIDIVIAGSNIDEKLDEIITIHGEPVMINITTNPKGILILIYEDGLCIDMDIRKTITYKELHESMVLVEVNEELMVDGENILRHENSYTLIPNKAKWYSVLRLVHRGTIKYLSNKTESASNLLSEVIQSLDELGINNKDLKGDFEEDIQLIFSEICKKFEVSNEIKAVFNSLFKEF